VKPATTLSENWEDYLERIHELIERKGYARVADIAEQLDIAAASVSTMVQRLAKAGLLNYERYRGLTLTPAGQAAALGIRHRHRVLTEFLSILGVPPDQVERDVEGMEHHMSSITVEKIEALLPRLNKIVGASGKKQSR
jgi:Mn-dependent DtxR family transcriptional regulator